MSPESKPQIKLLTVITETALEHPLQRDLRTLGAKGYTISDARGKGSRGQRDADWEASGNIRLEVVGDEATVRRIAEHLQQRYYDNYAMIIWLSDVEVLRPGKFSTPSSS
ncbi:P-II family nitrogen regulator [Wenzhouxiangella marina]|uniref:Nitrogen regulatory protein P-II n=1 Tax=Wenzhouxiangella marina TaxID=1579979 RepID=A0A0K0XUF6_9GAMM|nr:hypothetical protein [Wenzhouxiangella marina]AKS41318.1 Nitrogen regulatory protein P-II [Wenzhouxiangella marina]MBB6086932.1 nitrogen regulatory protein PII [Wenzhouxiangella marina]